MQDIKIIFLISLLIRIIKKKVIIYASECWVFHYQYKPCMIFFVSAYTETNNKTLVF